MVGRCGGCGERRGCRQLGAEQAKQLPLQVHLSPTSAPSPAVLSAQALHSVSWGSRSPSVLAVPLSWPPSSTTHLSWVHFQPPLPEARHPHPSRARACSEAVPREPGNTRRVRRPLGSVATQAGKAEKGAQTVPGRRCEKQGWLDRPPTAARGSRLPTPEPRRRLSLPAPGCLRLPLPSPRRRGGPCVGPDAWVCREER